MSSRDEHKYFPSSKAGTAATADLTQGGQDITVGRVLKVGDYGFGTLSVNFWYEEKKLVDLDLSLDTSVTVDDTIISAFGRITAKLWNLQISDVENLQATLNGKQATITGAASTVTGSNLTSNRVVISNGSGKIAISPVTSTELSYLDGVTSNVQTQLDAKADSGDLSDYVTLTTTQEITGTKTLRATDLGTALGNETIFLRSRQFGSNESQLIFKDVRTDDSGTGWGTTGTRIQKRIDNTDMGFIEFNGLAGSYDVGIGSLATDSSGPNIIATFSRNGNVAVQGNVTGANLNISNWDEAYDWGDFRDYGLGQTGNYVNYPSSVISNDLAVGFYPYNVDTPDRPIINSNNTFGTLICSKRQETNGQRAILAQAFNQGGGLFHREINDSASADTGWCKVWDDFTLENPATEAWVKGFGLGGIGTTDGSGYQTDLDDLTDVVTQFFVFNSSTTNRPPGFTNGSGIHFRRTGGGGENQLALTDTSTNPAMAIRARTTGAWSSWREFQDSGNLPYEEVTVELGGDFNVGIEAKVVRIGSQVTVLPIGPPLHSSGVSILSSLGVVPVSLRPASIAIGFFQTPAGLEFTFRVNTDGYVSLIYAGSAQTSPDCQFSVSYAI